MLTSSFLQASIWVHKKDWGRAGDVRERPLGNTQAENPSLPRSICYSEQKL